MSDPAVVQELLKNHFSVKDNTWSIDSQGVVSVKGNVEAIGEMPNRKLPIKFGKVTGNFILQAVGCLDLEGCPTEVGGDFSCSMNVIYGDTRGGSSSDLTQLDNLTQLDSLKGGPRRVGGSWNIGMNAIPSLQHMPAEIGYNTSNCAVDLSWEKHYSVLPLVTNKVNISNYSDLGVEGAPDDLRKILFKYMNKPTAAARQSAALACAAELIRAGYREAARM